MDWLKSHFELYFYQKYILFHRDCFDKDFLHELQNLRKRKSWRIKRLSFQGVGASEYNSVGHFFVVDYLNIMGDEILFKFGAKFRR